MLNLTFLINCTGLKAGGGLQVADSVCRQLYRFKEHHIIVVLSRYLDKTAVQIKDYNNVEILHYDMPKSLYSVLSGRDKFLDGLVKDKKVDAVLSVFGPSLWRPRVPHLCGFAMAQLVIPESPFFYRMNNVERIKWLWWCKIRQWSFEHSADYFWTENPFITSRVVKLISKRVYTVTNYYNQVFDQPEQWQRIIQLPEFDGTTLLTISSTGAHKNLGIMVPLAEHLEQEHSDFNFRFVLTCKVSPFELPEHLAKHFVFVGKVDVSECPNLYEQADIMFMPTLLECFTATYPEAMRMEVPIVTTDLEFAHGLCCDAACYYSAVDSKAAADAIYKVATDKAYRSQLTANGKEQLKKFDNYEQRAEKLIAILEKIATT